MNTSAPIGVPVRVCVSRWAAVTFACLIVAACGPSADPAQSKVDNQLASMSDPPLGSGEKTKTEKSAGAPAKEELKQLYEELQTFKGNPRFHEAKFGRCCEYLAWKERVDVADRHGKALLKDLGFAPRELVTLAGAYADSRGRQTERTRQLEGLIKNGIEPPRLNGGEGRLITSGRWCTAIEPMEDLFKGVEMNDMELAGAPETDPRCREYPKGSKVGPVLEERSIRFSDGTVAEEMVLVKAADGRRIWVAADEASFK